MRSAYARACQMTKTNSSDRKERVAGEIALIQRHGHGVAASFAERRCGALYDPEDEGELGILRSIKFGSVICRRV